MCNFVLWRSQEEQQHEMISMHTVIHDDHAREPNRQFNLKSFSWIAIALPRNANNDGMPVLWLCIPLVERQTVQVHHAVALAQKP